MADQVLTKQKLINADEDLGDLEEILNGPPGKLVKTRLGREVYTLASVPQINTMTREEVAAAVAPKANKVDVDTALTAYVGGRKAYTTLALAQADQVNLTANTAIEVTNDGANNGTYQWNGTTLTKSAYDPLRQTIAELDKMRGSVRLNEDLKSYLNEGLWGIASGVVQDGKSKDLGYPSDLDNVFTELRCSKLHTGHISQVLTQQNGIWMRLIDGGTGATQTDWVRLVDRNKALKNISLTSIDNLNNLNAGLYAFSSDVLQTAIDSDNLGYPKVNRLAGGGQIIVSALSTGHSVQTIIFARAALMYTRQKVGTSFTEWLSIGNQSINWIGLQANLKTFTGRGSWGIASGVVQAGKAESLGYPSDMSNAFTSLTCDQTHNGYTTQVLTQQDGIWMRLIDSTTGATQTDWVRLVDRNKTSMQNVVLTSDDDLNTIRTEGVYPFTTTVLTSVLDAGNTKNYPKGLTNRLGGGHMLVSKSGNFPVQTIFFARQARVFSRQLVGSSFTEWAEVGNQKTVVVHGSSSMSGMSSLMSTAFWRMGALYVNAARGGQSMEGSEGYMEVLKLKLSFSDGVIPLNTSAPITMHFETDYTGYRPLWGIEEVTLSNGLKGTLSMTDNTFTPKNAVEVFDVGDTQFDIDFGYAKYARDAIHIFNLGKNNISGTGYTAQDIIKSYERMIERLDSFYNRKFIVIGHYSNNSFTQNQKDIVAVVNAALRAKYFAHYLDTQDYLMSSQVWGDLGITPTGADLTAQSNGVLAVSLSSDGGTHLSSAVNNLIMEKIKAKLLELEYF